jgi:aryl-alcohol dehydrogenase-like predicted oxidoreductase
MIPTAPFGRTGHQSTRTIFGAAALSKVERSVADRALALVLERGVNHIDTAASYGDSETLLGPWIAEHRSGLFLATKTGERRAAAARDELHRSLERLRTDHVDLLQLHNLVDEREWEVALGPGGALEAAIAAREEGLVRFIGVTGHGVEVAERHRASLERFPFDSVLLPYSFILMRDPGYARSFEALARTCRERGVALQTIKALTRRPWGAVPRGDAPTWYEPLRDEASIGLAVHWVLGRPDAFLNTVGDVDLLPFVFDAAASFEARPTDEAMRALIDEHAMEPLFV